MSRYTHTQNPPADFKALSHRLSAAIEAGDPVVTDRAIRLVRNRGDWHEAERLTADFLRITGQSTDGRAKLHSVAARDGAAVLATFPLDERLGRS